MMDFNQLMIKQQEALALQHFAPNPGLFGNLIRHMDPVLMNQYYDDDDDDDDDDDHYEDVSSDYDEENEMDYLRTTTYCGLQKSFLTTHTVPSSNQESAHPLFSFKMPLQHKVTPEEAEKNAKELVEEEERIKNKAEKKKLKKLRQKDRKRQQKLEEELKNKKKEIRNKDAEKASVNVSTIKEEEIEKEKQGVSTYVGTGPPDSKERGQVKNSTEVAAPPQPDSTCSEDTEDSEEDEDDDLAGLDAELDMASTFVSQVWRKVESKPKIEKREKKIIKKEAKVPETLSNKSPEKLREKKNECVVGINPLQQSVEFAALGNSMASGGHFAAAVVYFTEAIKLNPRDIRLFGNRSYCWERIGDFSKALGDAEVSIGLDRTFLKGYFRKGKSLMGMKRFAEAMLAFKHILQEDCTHVEAARELKECERILQQVRSNSGNQFKMPDLVPIPQDFRLPSPVGSKDYVKMEAAFGGLSLNSSCTSSIAGDGPVLITTCGQKPNGPAALQKPTKSTKEPAGAVLQPRPPMPSQLYPIWVGNITPRITGEIILSRFQRFGAIHSIRILYDRTCAFINFASKEGAEAAFSGMQGVQVEGTTFVLQLRHPDHASITRMATNPRPMAKEGVKIPALMECQFWRNDGCNNGASCRFRHIPQNKGIDFK